MSAQVLLQASWLSATSVPDSSGAGTLEDPSILPCCQSVPSEPSLRCLLISASTALLLQSPAVSMASKVAVQNIKVWIVTLGGSVQDDEERLVVSVRQRLNRHFAQLNVEKVAAAAFAYGLEPVVQYMVNALPALKVQAYSPKELAENAFDAFKIIAARTRLTRKWAQVIDSASAWTLVEGSLTEVANGRTLQAPALDDGSMPTGGSCDLRSGPGRHGPLGGPAGPGSPSGRSRDLQKLPFFWIGQHQRLAPPALRGGEGRKQPEVE